jgi:putative FmdB family regulatory protein
MPSYDFRCNNCQRNVVLTFKTYADYDTGPKICPRCQSTDLRRRIGRVALARSEASRFSSLDDESMLDDLSEADPATLGRFMRRMGSEAGEDLGDEFNEVVDRLERGEDPEAIESSMALPPESDGEGESVAEGGGFADSAASSDD